MGGGGGVGEIWGLGVGCSLECEDLVKLVQCLLINDLASHTTTSEPLDFSGALPLFLGFHTLPERFGITVAEAVF